MSGHWTCWASRLLVMLALALSVVNAEDAGRRMLAVDGVAELTKAPTCAKNKFFPLPTAWQGTTGYLIGATAENAQAFCTRQKLASAGAIRTSTLSAAKLSTVPVQDLTTGNTCTAPTCSFLTAVECVPAGGAPCKADKNGNVGTKNRGKNNFGHNNRGSNNIGSGNTKSFCIGDSNKKSSNFVGCADKGVRSRRGITNLGSVTKNPLSIFGGCTKSRVTAATITPSPSPSPSPRPPSPSPTPSPQPNTIATPKVTTCAQQRDVCLLLDGSATGATWEAQQILALGVLASLGQAQSRIIVQQFGDASMTTIVADTSKGAASNAAAQITAAKPLGDQKTTLLPAFNACNTTLFGWETGHAMRLVLLLARSPSDIISMQLPIIATQNAGVEIIAVSLAKAAEGVLNFLTNDNANSLKLPDLTAASVAATAQALSDSICADGECQKRSTSSGFKITGGTTPAYGSYEFTAKVRMVSSLGENALFDCTGALIAPRVVLLAAKCVYQDPVAKQQFSIGFVDIGLSSTFCRGNAARRKGTWVPHPNYDPATGRNDIALIILDKAVPNVKPIALAAVGSAPSAGVQLDATGWGWRLRVPANLISNRLVKTTLVTQACTTSVSSTHFCIGPSAGQPPSSACQGDEGGPVFTPGDEPVLVGVVSEYVGAECTGTTIVTSTAALRTWIVDSVAANGVSF